MAGPPVTPQPAQSLKANPIHPLENLGLGLTNPDGPALFEQLAALPGQLNQYEDGNAMLQGSQAEQQYLAAQLGAPQGPQPAQGQPGQYPNMPSVPYTQPSVTPQTGPQPTQTPAQAQVDQFNQQWTQEQAQAQGQPQGQQPATYQQPQQGSPPQQEQVAITQEDYNFMIGHMDDLSRELKRRETNGHTPVPGPSGIPATSLVDPKVLAEQQAGQIPPIVVPKLEAPDISEAQFERITTDRAEMGKFLAERDQRTAATVTEQLSLTVLPHIQAYVQRESQNNQAMNVFLAANPDLAQHPEALTQAVTEAKVALPYAGVERIMYYAAQKLRGTMQSNDIINQNVTDLRGQIRGRRAPTINNPQVLRRGPGENPMPANPMLEMKLEMMNHTRGGGDILTDMGLKR